MSQEGPAKQLIYWAAIIGGIVLFVYGITHVVKFFLPN